MSNTDSFVDEVTDAVRRDRLFAAFRKYGWIGALLVVAIVGGAAVREYLRAQNETRAEAFGDAALAALTLTAPAERDAALAALPVDRDQMAVQVLLQAAAPEGDKAASLAALDALAADGSQSQVYRDMALLRRVALAGADQPVAERRAALESLAVPGRAFRVLALEQLAYLALEEGKRDEALAALTALIQDQESPVGQRRRLGEAIVALGGEVPEPAQAVSTDAPASGG
jgi:hypothetical protein